MIGILFAGSVFAQCPPTTPTITGTSVLCDGASGSLSASGSGDTYTWSPGGANTASIGISPGATTTYSVLMGQTGCTLTSAAVITVTVANTPTVVASVPSLSTAATSFTTCAFGSIYTFSASGASTYTWSTGETTDTMSVMVAYSTWPPSFSEAITVTGQNACGTATAAITVTVYSTPPVHITPANPVICSGQSVTLKANGPGTVYEWRAQGSSSLIATTSSVTVSPTATTNYYLYASYGSPCYIFNSVTVTVNTCTGIGELSGEREARLYPNPVGDLLHVVLEDDSGPGILEVYDASGKMLLREAVSGPGNVIHTEALQAGIYFYKLSGKTGKFMKQ